MVAKIGSCFMGDESVSSAMNAFVDKLYILMTGDLCRFAEPRHRRSALAHLVIMHPKSGAPPEIHILDCGLQSLTTAVDHPPSGLTMWIL